MKKEETLSDKIAKDSAGGEVEFNEEYILVKNVRRFVKKLKEVLVCDFCKENPSYDMMCSQCNNAGIKINKIFGDKLT